MTLSLNLIYNTRRNNNNKLVFRIQFLPNSKDYANFPFVCPPSNVEAVLASVGGVATT